MINEKLSPISFGTIPKRGAIELAERPLRMKRYAIDAGALTLLAVLSGCATVLISSAYIFLPWLGASLFSFPLLMIASVCAVGSAYVGTEALGTFGKYLRERNPQFCLPENSSQEGVECENWLHHAVQSYNTLAKEWNEDSAEVPAEEMEVREGHRKILEANYADIMKKIKLLEKSVELQISLESQTEENPPPEAQKHALLPGYGLIGPSSLIK